MVYAGRPSPACKPCRVNRRRCDLKRPTCTSCIRTSSTCEGYRDTNALLIRDETAQVSEKTKQNNRLACEARLSTACKSRNPRNQGMTRSDGERSSIRPIDFISSNVTPNSLSIRIEEIACTFYMDKYIDTTSFSYLPKHWSEVVRDPAAQAALTSTSLAILAKTSGRRDMLRQAKLHYCTALTNVSSALGKPLTATSNGTLLSILLMTMFETLVFEARSRPSGWGKHVDGLTLVLQMRGMIQFESEFGISLFYHACWTIVASCFVFNGRSFPTQLRQLQCQVLQLLGDDNFTLKRQILLQQVADYHISRHGLDPSQCIELLLRFDQGAVDLRSILAKKQPFKVLVRSSQELLSSCSYSQFAHQYTSPRSFSHWNNLRMLRLVINIWLYRACQRSDDLEHKILWGNSLSATSIPDLRMTSIVRCLKLTEEILTSATYPLSTKTPNVHGSVFDLISPLYYSAEFEACPTPTKQRIINCLEEIAVRAGIEQAKEVAEALSGGRELNDW